MVDCAPTDRQQLGYRQCDTSHMRKLQILRVIQVNLMQIEGSSQFRNKLESLVVQLEKYEDYEATGAEAQTFNVIMNFS